MIKWFGKKFNWITIFFYLPFAICYLLLAMPVFSADEDLILGSGTKGAGPVAYWNFDEAGGPTAYDKGSGGNDGTLDAAGSGSNTTSSQMWTPQGKFGGCLEFDGTNDWVNLGSSNDITGDNLQTITISIWLKSTAAASEYAFSLKRAAGSPSTLISICLNTGGVGELGFMTRNYANTSHPVLDYAGNYNDGQWHHVVAVVNGLTRILYIDGIQRGTDQEGMQSVSGNTDVASIGAFNASQLYFSGLIDDVRVYRRALSADEARQEYNAGAAVLLASTNSTSYDPWSGNPPVGWWSFDERTGTTAYDRSGSGNDGTVGSGAGWVHGKYGAGLSFDGTSNGYVNCGTGVTDTMESAGTIMMWIYATARTGIFSRSTGSGWLDERLVLHCYATTKLDLTISNGTNYERKQSNSDLPLNQWTHIAVTWDGSNVKHYFNGILDRTQGQTYTPEVTGVKTWIGRVEGLSPNYFTGKIDEVKIYNYARTQAQVAWEYNKGKPKSWWKLDEGTGTSAYDSSGNNNNGTLVDMTPASDWVDGRYGKALDLDGLNDRIQGFSSDFFEWRGESLTLSAWIKQDAGEADVGYIFSKPWNGMGEYNYRFYINANDTLSVYLMGTTTWSKTTTDTIDTGNWHHIALTIDEATKGVIIYIDGKLSTSGTHNITAWSPSQGDTNVSLCIGSLYPYGSGWAGNTGFSFQGLLDDARIYNYARTAEQIKQDYNEGAAAHLGN